MGIYHEKVAKKGELITTKIWNDPHKIDWTQIQIPGINILEGLQKHLGWWWFNYHWLPSGMINTSVTGTGYIAWESDYIGLRTGTTTGSTAKMWKRATAFNGVETWDKKRMFGARVWVANNTEQIIWVVMGDVADPSAIINKLNHIGFTIYHSDLRISCANGTEQTSEVVKTIPVEWEARLEIIFYPGEKAEFYVDDELVGTLLTNLPTGTNRAWRPITSVIYNTAGVDRAIDIYVVKTLQEG